MEAPASSVVMEEHQQRQQPTTTEVDDAKNGVDGEGATAPAQPPSHPRSGPPIGTFAQQAPAPTAPPTSPPPLPPRLDALPLLAPKPQQEQHGEVPSERQAALAALDEEEIDDDALSLSEEEEGSAVVGVAKEEEGAAAVGGGMKRKRGRPPGSGAGPKPRSHENVKLPPCLKGVELVGPSVQAHIIEWVRCVMAGADGYVDHLRVRIVHLCVRMREPSSLHILLYAPTHHHTTISTDNGPKTLPTQYDYVRRLARFFTRMQTEPSLAPHLLKDGADGTKQVCGVRVHDVEVSGFSPRLLGPNALTAFQPHVTTPPQNKNTNTHSSSSTTPWRRCGPRCSSRPWPATPTTSAPSRGRRPTR